MEGEGEKVEEEAREDSPPSVSATSDEESAQDQSNESSSSSGSSGMEGGHSEEPEVVAGKVKYLCGEDEDTLPDRFGDRKSGQVQL